MNAWVLILIFVGFGDKAPQELHAINFFQSERACQAAGREVQMTLGANGHRRPLVVCTRNY